MPVVGRQNAWTRAPCHLARPATRLRARKMHIGPEGTGGLTARSIVRAAPILQSDLPQKSSFRVLGNGSMVQVQMVPSVPLTARRNSLVGVLGSQAHETSSRLTVANGLIMRLLGRQPVLYQTILSTENATCLIAAAKRPARITTLDLDGSLDWIVTYPATVHAYAGNSLHFRPRTAFSMHMGAPAFAHTIISGRGTAVLSSPGELLQVQLEAGESILIHKRHLGAYSVDPDTSHKRPRTVELPYTFVQPKGPGRLASISFGNPTLSKIWHTAAHYARVTVHALRDIVYRGNQSAFIEIHGPSTVLVSAAYRPILPNRVSKPREKNDQNAS